LAEKNHNKIYGLVGKNINYSFSGQYFAQKFSEENIKDSVYEIYDLKEISEVEKLFGNQNLKGLNVTIPYKEQIIPYLDELSPEAKEIGVVNCVKIENRKKTGFNTDAFGFENSLKPLLKSHHRSALVLGNGGAAKAVTYVLKKLEISFQIVSRNGIFTYRDLDEEEIRNHHLIINCTPLGTSPNINEAPEIPYEFLAKNHLLYDLIYNPPKTRFLQLGEKQKSQIKNGLEMLVLQAEKSWEIWNRAL
jgi:shikimate dehydrogenase